MYGRRSRGGTQMDRRYGFFRCKNCRKVWESSHVYCRRGTDVIPGQTRSMWHPTGLTSSLTSALVMFRQDCKECKTACFPYKVEKIQCSLCGLTECQCTEEELEEKQRHVDPSKPHLASLCHKCRAGKPCRSSY